VKHYDPAEWSSPPLEGRIVDRPGLGKTMVGRGAVNQKGPETAEQERACLDAAAALGTDYAGVDLLDDHVLELNGIPGWHGLQKATGVDVATALVAHLESR